MRPRPARTTRLAVVARAATATNTSLVAAALRAGLDADLLTPEQAAKALRPGDVALGRLDVLPDTSGIERGMWELRLLERRGVRVLNGPTGLVGAHDKLATAARLHAAGVPHPATEHLRPGHDVPALEPPLVLKPRYGSWGRDVLLAEDGDSLAGGLAALESRHWYPGQGLLAQDLVPPRGHDLRVVVSGGHVVGAVSRVAAPGEWRTNVALGAVRRPAEADAAASALALAAAHAVGLDLAGIDLLPVDGRGWVVLEVNGAVDFTAEYAPNGDVYRDAVEALAEAARPLRQAASSPR